MEGAENPILYVEECRRLPLRPRRPEIPGTVLVYRSRSGRLSVPANGYTAGELWWRGPRVQYEIDVTSHPLRLTWAVDNAHGVRAAVEVHGFWGVVDPRAVVANRVTDGPRRCRARIEIAIGAAFAESRGIVQLAAAVRGQLPTRLRLAEGLVAEQLRVRVHTGGPRQQLIRELFAADTDDDGGGRVDPVDELRNDVELARAGLDASEEYVDDGVVGAALRRYVALLARLQAHAADDKPESR